MLYTRRLFNALKPVMSRGKESVPLSDNTLKDVITKALGKPTSSDEINYFKRKNNIGSMAPCFAGEIRPKLKLIAAAIDHQGLPALSLPEVAFYGRTNSGKSCLINAICGRFGVCTVKDLPGTTRKLYFYKVGSPASIILVDLPGYGYSSAKEDIKLQWNEFSLSYLKKRESLKLVVILIDSRIGLKQSDLEVINFCDKYKIRWQLVLAKADAMKPVLLAKMMHKVKLETKGFRSSNGKVVAVSATKNQNLDELRDLVDVFAVDKRTAAFWSTVKPEKAGSSDIKDFSLAKLQFTNHKDAFTDVKGEHKLSSGIELQPSESIVTRYNLWRHIDEADDPLSTDHVVLQCVAEIFDTMTPPKGLVEFSAPCKEVTITEMTVEPTVREFVEPSFVEADDNLLCNINVSIEDTLRPSEEVKVVHENLIEDKIKSYKKRLLTRTETIPIVSRPKIGRSYKRVLSMFKKVLKPKQLKWNVADQTKLSWSAVYQKWEKWSRKHPHLAGTVDAPTKRAVISTGRKAQIRKHQLQVHEERKKLRQGSPKINKKLAL
ncbi:p-loop containing nucleoside triphosphate hydrolase domain containing protein [Babesia gibsoni]|uniref:P-loop containing nucleoside triphosphate hydrolase domain containing protein n=1 Tax=Babesia gibsoni TaxID=33632 RepID=A0AAD8LRB7_BABGI|nr:p-loop containing nucleoside triphosphate hydrolase domain containing protein [Babesia gibsoni]